jgi:hypothetical protein
VPSPPAIDTNVMNDFDATREGLSTGKFAVVARSKGITRCCGIRLPLMSTKAEVRSRMEMIHVRVIECKLGTLESSCARSFTISTQDLLNRDDGGAFTV